MAKTILESVGNTPLLPLRRITAHLSRQVQVLVKADPYAREFELRPNTAARITAPGRTTGGGALR